MPRKQWFEVAADGGLVALPPPPNLVDDGWYRRLTSELYLLRAVDRIRGGHVTARFDATMQYALYAPPNDEWTRAWNVTEALLRKLRATVERDGARFAIVLLPSKEMVWPELLAKSLVFWGVSPAQYDVDGPHQKMTAFLATEGVAFVDLLPRMRTTAAGTGFLAWDPHLDRDGNAEVATAVAPFVAERLPERAAP